jgi:hypothetical protein
MSNFEFIAVLLSIIFGLAIANLLSGMLQAFLRRELTDTRLAWSILVGNILLVDWGCFSSGAITGSGASTSFSTSQYGQPSITSWPSPSTRTNS